MWKRHRITPRMILSDSNDFREKRLKKTDMQLWILFPLAITLHNLEEAIWLPGWSQHARRFQRPVQTGEFRFAVSIITLMAYLSYFLALKFPETWFWNHLFHGFLGVMIVNTFVPHLASTILLRRYSPGLASGLLLLTPINSIILTQSILSGRITLPNLLWSVLAVGLMLISLIPLLFKLGRSISKQVE